MRVAASLYDTEDEIVQCYNALSSKLYTHATPTLFNAGMKKGQYASCFLGVMQEDSIMGIFNTVKQCALISKTAGGIGLSISNIRATGARISMVRWVSLTVSCQCFASSTRQRATWTRAGAEKDPLPCTLNRGMPTSKPSWTCVRITETRTPKARDLFTALWVPDLFMERVRQDGDWTLFCPKTVNLQNVHSDAFRAMYQEAEENLPGKRMKARTLWEKIIRTQIETGTPYIMYKDRVNSASNQQHLGTIKGSNLCAEVVEYTSPDQVAVCTLASIALPKFMSDEFDFQKLGDTVEQVVRNLDRVIDVTYYPLQEAKNSNMKHRPMGIGVQGLADVIQMNKMAYDSEEAVAFDAAIFETMYYHALRASCQLAREKGPHESFEGSPASKGVLQFDFFNVTPTRYDWVSLKEDIMQYGIRNSLLMATMPTASTAQILGNSEGTDPRTSNLYNRRVLSGEFMVENHVLRTQVDNWEEVKKVMLRDYGSVQKAPVSDEIKARFKTVWEMSQKWVIKHAAARQPFICQSQSMNLFLAEPTVNQVNAMHFYAWQSKLKTGMYYLRTRPKVNPVQIVRECESCSA